jgi:hypothetical protein
MQYALIVFLFLTKIDAKYPEPAPTSNRISDLLNDFIALSKIN